MEKRLGKIVSVNFGLEGCMVGIHVSIEGHGWGVNTSKSTWDVNKVEWSDRCAWTESDRSSQYDEIMRYVSDLLEAAKVGFVDELKGIPVEVVFDRTSLESWRILTEVI